MKSEIKSGDEKVQRSFEKLKYFKGESDRLYKWIIRAFEDLEENAFCGIQIPKRLTPKEYIEKYNTTNLWKYNLPNAWRLIYTVKNSEISILSIILEWMSHKDYEKRFRY